MCDFDNLPMPEFTASPTTKPTDTPEVVQRWLRWMQERPAHPGCADNTEPMYENVDNFRFACITDAEACIKYAEIYQSGCCGSVDQVMEDKDGKLWIVGFNYGH